CSMMVLMRSDTGEVLDVNKSAARFFGADSSDADVDALPSPSRAALDEVVSRVQHRQRSTNVTAPVRTGRGDRVVEIYATPMAVDDVDVLFLVLHDVTERIQASEVRKRGYIKFRTLIEQASDMLVVLDEDANFTFVSPSMTHVMGYEAEDLVGSPAMAMVHPDERDEMVMQWGDLLARPGEPIEMTYRMQCADGAYLIIAASARNLLHNPDVLGVVINSRDVTELMEAHARLIQREGQLGESQRLAHVGSWEWDLDGDILIWSDELKRIYGFDPEVTDLLTLDVLLRALHHEDRDWFTAVVERAQQDAGPFELEHRIVQPSGAVRTVIARGRVVVDEYDQPVKMYGSCQDVTDARRKESELKQYAQRLEQSNRELEEFAYVASHDLQEPLRKIQAFGDRLQRRFGAVLEDTGINYLTRMQSAASRMSVLIDDLLTYSRVTTRARPYESVDLNQVVAEVLEDLEIRCVEKRASLDVAKLPTIDADPMQMRQLFQNLISNALKFHKPDQPAHVCVSCELLEPSLSARDRVPARVEIQVEDDGIGFDQKYADTIFGPFQRLHGRNEFSGTGIGLAICRKIVEQHQGAIMAFSAPGDGATFVVTLPLRHERDDAPAPQDP
ncbi:MAG: PAS domain S-box protein, partial [Myxococcota bacterium]